MGRTRMSNAVRSVSTGSATAPFKAPPAARNAERCAAIEADVASAGHSHAAQACASRGVDSPQAWQVHR